MRKHIFAAAIVCIMMLISLPSTVLADDRPTSGTCGENLTWTYESTIDSLNRESGVLTISGIGPMHDYESHCSPWRDYPISMVNIEHGVTTIGTNAFQFCKQLSDIVIPNSVTTIGTGSLERTIITSLSIPSSVIRIDGISDLYEKLTEVNVDPNNRIYTSVDGALLNKQEGKLIFCPKNKISFTIPDGTISIGSNVFKDHTNLVNVTIPNSVSEICTSAFEGCTNLSSINIPDSVTSISFSAFAGCTSLTNVTIPGSVNWIGRYAFMDCTHLTLPRKGIP